MTRCTRNIGKFGRIVAASALAVGLLPALVHAQKGEVSVFGGYTTSEGIHASEDRIITGITYNQLDITSGGSWGLTGGYYITPAFELEFLYNNQFSTFQAKGPAGTLKLADANVNNYHGLFTYNWGEEGGKVRPFAFGGLGATHYAPGDLSIPGFSGRNIDSSTKFSSTWGGGVKVYAGAVGVKVMARYTPTYIKTSDAGVWCDPYYFTCWVVGNPDYSNQFDISGGVTIRFGAH